MRGVPNPLFSLVPDQTLDSQVRHAAAKRLGAMLHDEKIHHKKWLQWVTDNPDDPDAALLLSPPVEQSRAVTARSGYNRAIRMQERRDAVIEKKNAKLMTKIEARRRLVIRFPHFSAAELADWIIANPKDPDAHDVYTA